MAEFSDEFNRLEAALRRAGQDTKMFVDGFRRATQAGKGVNAVLDDMQGRLDRVNGAYKGMSGVITDLNKILKENLGEISKQNSAIKDGTRAYRKLVNEVTKLSDEESDIYALNTKTLKTIRDRTRSSVIEFKLAAKRLAISKGIVDIEHVRLGMRRDLSDEERAMLTAYQQQFATEEKSLALAEGRLRLEENVERSLRGSLNLVGAFQKIAGGIGLTGFAKDLSDISDQLNNDIRKQIRKNAEDELAIESDVYRENLNTVRTLEAKLAAGKELTDEEVNRLTAAREIVNESEEEVLNRTKNLGLVQRTLLTFKQIPKVAGALLKNLTDVNFIMAAIYKNFTAVDAAGVEFQRITGQNAKALAGMNSNLVTSVETLKMMGEVSTRLNMNLNGIMGPEQVGRLTESVKLLGLGADEAAGLAKFSTISGESIDEFQKSVVESTNKFNGLNKSAINHGQVMQDVLSTSDDIALSLGGDAGRIAAAAAAARKLGMDLKRVDGIAGSLMDFESSIQNELEAQLLTGGNINLSKARELALNNDLEGLSAEIANNNALTDKFSSSNRIQQESMAKALGMSRDELARMIALEKIREGVSKKEAARASGMTVEQLQQLSIQEKLNTLISKLGQAFGPFLDMLHPVVDLIGAMLAPLANSVSHTSALGVEFRKFIEESQGFKDFLVDVKEVMGGVVDFFKGTVSTVKSLLENETIKSVLGLFGGAGKIAMVGALGIGVNKLLKGKLGTKNNPMFVRMKEGGKSMINEVKSLFSKKPGTETKGIKGLINSFKSGGVKGGISKGAQMGKSMLGKAGGVLGKAGPIAALTSAVMSAKGIFDFASSDKMRATGGGGFAESMGGTGMKILDTLTFGLTKKLTEMANITIPGMSSDDIADARAIYHASGRDPDNSRFPMAVDNQQLIQDILTNSSAYPEHIIEAAGKVDMGALKQQAIESQPVAMAEGGIVPTATNALIGEAGAEAVVPLREFYAKFDELIGVVKQGGNVYIDGNAAGKAMVLSTYKNK